MDYSKFLWMKKGIGKVKAERQGNATTKIEFKNHGKTSGTVSI